MRNEDVHNEAVNLNNPDDLDAFADESDHDTDVAIHEAVLAAKETRSPKLTPPRRPIPPVPLTRSRILPQKPHASETQIPHDTRRDGSTQAQRLSPEIILLWAEMHFERTAAWPDRHSGAVVDCPGEWWNILESLLANGGRGLPGGSSIAELINESPRLVRRADITELTEEQILTWADDWHERTGSWPDRRSAEFAAPDTSATWLMISSALLYGSHGLPGGKTLQKLLRENRDTTS